MCISFSTDMHIQNPPLKAVIDHDPRALSRVKNLSVKSNQCGHECPQIQRKQRSIAVCTSSFP